MEVDIGKRYHIVDGPRGSIKNKTKQKTFENKWLSSEWTGFICFFQNE